MAVTGTEPVSAENLQDIVGSIMERVGREVVYVGQGGNFWAPPSEFDQLEVNISTSNYGVDFQTFTVPNETQSISIGSNLLDIDVTDGGSIVSARNNRFEFTARIVGIRSGGGQLLADLLAALGGEAA